MHMEISKSTLSLIYFVFLGDASQMVSNNIKIMMILFSFSDLETNIETKRVLQLLDMVRWDWDPFSYTSKIIKKKTKITDDSLHDRRFV